MMCRNPSLPSIHPSPIKLPSAEHFPSTEICDHEKCKEGLALRLLGYILQDLGAPKMLYSALIDGGILAMLPPTHT